MTSSPAVSYIVDWVLGSGADNVMYSYGESEDWRVQDGRGVPYHYGGRKEMSGRTRCAWIAYHLEAVQVLVYTRRLLK